MAIGSKDITRLVAGNSVERSNFVFNRPNEIADFCLNKCPHPKKSCNGTCPEYKTFIREKFHTKNPYNTVRSK